MRDSRTVLAGAALACAMLAAPAAAIGDDAPWTAEQQAVIDAVSNGPLGIESDFDAWADGYHADWSYWRAGADAVRARAEHMGLVRDYIESGARVESFEMTPIDVIIRNEVALLRYAATETLREADGEVRVVRYASADTLVRDAGGWQVLATNIVYLPDADD